MNKSKSSVKMTKKILVKVEKVNFSFGSTKVLNNISFSIMQGDFLGIIGPNGSGKTTLLKLMLGLLPLKSGRISLFGDSIKDMRSWDRIGYVPQKATNIDEYFPATVKEVVEMGTISKKKFPKLLDKHDSLAADEALNLVEMKEFENRRIGALSGGQQQRVFIARAIVSKPEILFLDEPTTGVDKKSQERFYDLLHSLNEKGITIILITHDIGAITDYVTKVACLNQELAFHGTHEEFCDSHLAHEFMSDKQHMILHRH